MTVQYCQHGCNHSILIHPLCQCYQFTQFLSLPSIPKPFIPSNTVAELSVTPTFYNTVNSRVFVQKQLTALSVVTEVPAYTLRGQILIPCKALQIFPLTTRSSLQCTIGIYHHIKVQ
jgi:carbohydrate-binding DOMON domain-containing protein